jgi:hypothetical protein
MEHSSNLVDNAIADAWMKQKVIRTYGAKTKPPITKGWAPFSGTPIYSGWHGPREITTRIEEMYNPPGTPQRIVGNYADRHRNTTFGLADLAVTAVHFPLALAQSGIPAGFSALNRSLEMMNLPHVMMDFYGPEGADRMAFWAKNHLEVTAGPSGLDPGKGTMLSYLGKPGRTLDQKAVDKWVNFANDIQFKHGLGSIRIRAAEGGLLIMKMLGRDVNDPVVVRQAAEWANAMTGAGRPALRVSRAGKERMMFTAPQMIRSQIEALTKVAKGTFSPTATAEERLLGMTTLASFGAFLYGTQYIFNQALPAATGTQKDPMSFIPGQPGFAMIRIPGTDKRTTILPSRSLLGAIAKSVEGLADADPAAISRAWTKFTVGRLNSWVQGPVGLTGYGYDKRGQFSYGDLPGEEALTKFAPIPPVGQNALRGQTDPGSVAGGVLGFNVFPVPSFQLLKEGWARIHPDDEFSLSDAKKDPKLKPLVDAWEKDQLASGSEGGQLKQQALDARKTLEMDSGIATDAEGDSGLASRFLAGEEVGPALIEADAKLRTGIAAMFTTTYVNSKEYDPKSGDDKVLAEMQANDINDYRGEDGAIDYDAFYAKDDSLKANLSPLGRELYEQWESKAIDGDWKQLEPQVKKARDLRSQLYDKPKYEGVSVAQQKQVEVFGQTVDKLRPKVMEALGYPVSSTAISLVLSELKGTPEMGRTYNDLQEKGLSEAYKSALKAGRSRLEPFFPYLYDSANELAAIGAISEVAPGQREPRPPREGARLTRRQLADLEAVKRVLPGLLNGTSASSPRIPVGASPTPVQGFPTDDRYFR